MHSASASQGLPMLPPYPAHAGNPATLTTMAPPRAGEGIMSDAFRSPSSHRPRATSGRSSLQAARLESGNVGGRRTVLWTLEARHKRPNGDRYGHRDAWPEEDLPERSWIPSPHHV